MRINQEGNKTRMFAASEVKKTGSAFGTKEEKRVNGLTVNPKEESEDKPKSLLEKLIVQKKSIVDQVNQLRSGDISEEVRMTKEQREEKIKELTVQLAAVNQALVQEHEKIIQEQKEKLEEQQEKRKLKIEKKENSENMTPEDIVAKNVNRSMLSASGGIQNLKLRNHVRRAQDSRKNIVAGEMKMDISQGGSVEAKMKELNELNKKTQYVSNEIMDLALTPIVAIPKKERSEIKAEETEQGTETAMLNRNQTPKSEVISDNLPNSTSNINYLV